MAVTLPAGAAKRRHVEAMFDRIAGRYDRLNAVISLGLHGRWKRAAAAALAVPPGARVVDLACGTGDLAAAAARAGARPIGIDVSAGMLDVARRRGVPAPLVRASGDALPLPDAAVDGLLCGFALRNFVDLASVFAEIARVLRPGARAAFLEVDTPTGGTVRAAHRCYFRGVVPLVGALLSDRDAYAYLPSSTAYLPDEAELTAMLRAAGFARVEKRRLMLGAAQLLVATRSAPC